MGQPPRRPDHRPSRGVHFGRAQRLVGPWWGAVGSQCVGPKGPSLRPVAHRSVRAGSSSPSGGGTRGGQPWRPKDRNTALKASVGGPSAYVAWGHTRRTLEWQRGREGHHAHDDDGGIRAEWLSSRDCGRRETHRNSTWGCFSLCLCASVAGRLMVEKGGSSSWNSSTTVVRRVDPDPLGNAGRQSPHS